jgi:hypothetical protein
MNFYKRQLHDDIFLKIEGGCLLDANWRVQTLIRIDLKVCNAIQQVRRCPPTRNKKHP